MEQIIFLKINWKWEFFFGGGQFSEFTICELYKTEFNKVKDSIFIKNVV